MRTDIVAERPVVVSITFDGIPEPFIRRGTLYTFSDASQHVTWGNRETMHGAIWLDKDRSYRTSVKEP